jgi:hypothetical protein
MEERGVRPQRIGSTHQAYLVILDLLDLVRTCTFFYKVARSLVTAVVWRRLVENAQFRPEQKYVHCAFCNLLVWILGLVAVYIKKVIHRVGASALSRISTTSELERLSEKCRIIGLSLAPH